MNVAVLPSKTVAHISLPIVMEEANFKRGIEEKKKVIRC